MQNKRKEDQANHAKIKKPTPAGFEPARANPKDDEVIDSSLSP